MKMFSFTRKKVAFKLALTVTLVIVLVQSLFSFIEVVSYKVDMEAALIENKNTLTDIAANAFADGLWTYNQESVKAIAESLMKNKEIAGIQVTDNDVGNVFTLKKSGKAYSEGYLSEISSPIFYEENEIASVQVVFTDFYLLDSVSRRALGKILEAITTTLLMISAIMLGSYRITNSIKILSCGTDEIAAGNLEKQIEINSSDEIGELALKFNRMTKNLYHIMQEREKAIVALTTSEEKFSKTFQHSADLIGIVRIEDNRFIDISDSFSDSLGYDRNQVIEHTSEEFGLWSDPEEREAFYNQLKDQSFNMKSEARWCTKNGEVRVGLLANNQIEINGESCLIFVWHDITDRKLAEDALQLANFQLEAKVTERTKSLNELNVNLIDANRELVETLNELKATQTQLIQSEKLSGLATLVAGVAHEINTPLGISVTAISYLNDQLTRFETLYSTTAIKRQDLEKHIEQSKEVISMIINNLDRASKLVNSFKQVSIDQSTENKRTFKVKAYLEQLLLSLHPKIKKSHQQVIIHCPEDLEIKSYPGAYAQIITNLIFNSLLHAYEPETPGSIEITLTHDDRLLQMIYTDDGKGMDAGVKDKVFTPFFTTNREGGGTGLGLHIIYNIVTLQLNGSIVCESAPNKGTQFTITLPLTI